MNPIRKQIKVSPITTNTRIENFFKKTLPQPAKGSDNHQIEFAKEAMLNKKEMDFLPEEAEDLSNTLRKRRKASNFFIGKYKQMLTYKDMESDEEYEIHSRRSKNSSKRKNLDYKKTTQVNNASKLELVFQWQLDIKQQCAGVYDLPYSETFKKIENLKLSSYGRDLHAILLAPPWGTLSGGYLDMKIFSEFILNNFGPKQKLIRNGIIFIWIDKEFILDVVLLMQKHGFNYIENFSLILLDSQKLASLSQKDKTISTKTSKKLQDFFITKQNQPQPSDTSTNSEYSPKNPQDKIQELPKSVLEDLVEKRAIYSKFTPEHVYCQIAGSHFQKSKRTLLMFRKSEAGTTLELRHQRTCDVLFDFYCDEDPFGLSLYAKQYIYKMIETLLPTAQKSGDNNEPKLMSVWFDERQRKGWASLYQDLLN